MLGRYGVRSPIGTAMWPLTRGWKYEQADFVSLESRKRAVIPVVSLTFSSCDWKDIREWSVECYAYAVYL